MVGVPRVQRPPPVPVGAVKAHRVGRPPMRYLTLPVNYTMTDPDLGLQ